MRAGVALSLCLCLTACTAPNNSPRATPTAGASAQTNPSSSPLASQSPAQTGTVPSSTPSAGTNSLPTGSGSVPVTDDNEMRQNLLAIIRQKFPSIQENPLVSQITGEHSRQLATDTKNTEFKVLQQKYDPVAPGALQTRLLQTGVYSSDNLVNAYLSDGDPVKIRERFGRQLDGIVPSTPFSHFGLGVARRGNGWYVSTVFVTQILQIENLTPSIASTGTRSITGELKLAGYSSPSILMTRPDGSVRTVSAQQAGNRFSADLPLDQSGLYSFEVNVQGPLGPLPATNFVLAVGVPYPSTAPISDQSETISDLDQARQTLLDLVNRDRQAQGQSVLTLDSGLNLAAQAHSDDMVQNGFIAHNSPTQGTPQQQAFKFNVTELISQNISSSRTLANSERELMSSPGHRKTIINPNHTHVGFGVKAGRDGFLYITQLFVQRKLSLDPIAGSVQRGKSFMVTGTAPRDGFVAAFTGSNVLADPIPVKQGQRFQMPVVLNNTGKQRLQIGYSEPPNTEFFNFYNIWDLEVSP